MPSVCRHYIYSIILLSSLSVTWLLISAFPPFRWLRNSNTVQVQTVNNHQGVSRFLLAFLLQPHHGTSIFEDFLANCWSILLQVPVTRKGRIISSSDLLFTITRNVNQQQFYCQFSTQTYVWKLKILWPGILLKLVTGRGQFSVTWPCKCAASRQERARRLSRAISRVHSQEYQDIIPSKTTNVTYEYFFRFNKEYSGQICLPVCVFSCRVSLNYLRTLKTDVHLNYIRKFSFCLTKHTIPFHYSQTNATFRWGRLLTVDITRKA